MTTFPPALGSHAVRAARWAYGTADFSDRVRARLPLGAVAIDRVDSAGAALRMRGFLDSARPHQVVTVNLDYVAKARVNAEFRDAISKADLVVADGMPLVWISRLAGDPLPERLTGFVLVDEACRLACEAQRSVFLLGSSIKVLLQASKNLAQRHPGLETSWYAPPFGSWSGDEDSRIMTAVRKSNPAFLFVALGAPRQEVWIQEHLHELGVPVVIGVGAVLDAEAGVVKRAPVWAQQSGLEWSFRLAQEPRRLWRRYLIDDVPMLGRLLVEAARALDPW